MEETNSGYDGAWVTGDERNTFDASVYYNMMISSEFTFRSRSLATGTGDAARPIYSATDATSTQVGNFINADFALVYDFEVEADDRFADCFTTGSGRTWTADSQTCDQASTYDLVKSFAEDNDLWLVAYYEA